MRIILLIHVTIVKPSFVKCLSLIRIDWLDDFLRERWGTYRENQMSATKLQALWNHPAGPKTSMSNSNYFTCSYNVDSFASCALKLWSPNSSLLSNTYFLILPYDEFLSASIHTFESDDILYKKFWFSSKWGLMISRRYPEFWFRFSSKKMGVAIF